MPSIPPRLPNLVVVMDLDQSEGFDRKAKVKLQQVMRGDSALQTRSRIMAMSPADAERAIKAYWRQGNPWVEPDKVSWRFDEQRGTLLLTATGEGKLEWEGDDAEGRSLNILGAGFTPPAEYRRPKEQDQSAPWLTDYPAYRCWATAIHLPLGNSKWKWDYFSDPVDTRMGGVHYWRVADLRGGVMRTVMSRRYEVPEITAAEAEEVNQRLPKFNNKVSTVHQIPERQRRSDHGPLPPAPPFRSDTDWTSPDAPCGGSMQ